MTRDKEITVDHMKISVSFDYDKDDGYTIYEVNGMSQTYYSRIYIDRIKTELENQRIKSLK